MARKEENSTIVSVFPLEIRERKVGIYPEWYVIPAAPHGGVGTLIVKPTFTNLYVGGPLRVVRQLILSDELCMAIIQDFIRSKIAYSTEQHPGLGFLEGDWTPEAIQKEKLQFVLNLRRIQTNWYKELVRLADDEWRQFGLHKMISEEQRNAAKALGLDREWAKDIQEEKIVKCPACGTMNMDVAVCSNCRCVLDDAKFKKLQFAS